MNLDRMSRRSLLGTGALLTIEKAIGPTSAAQPVDTKEQFEKAVADTLEHPERGKQFFELHGLED
jgi:hypothetical protein